MSSKGKGKIRLRSGRAVASASLRLVAGVSHEDVQHGVRDGDPTSRFASLAGARWAPYLRREVSNQASLMLELGAEARPFVLADSRLLRPGLLPDAPSLASMVEGEGEVEALCVEAHEPTAMRCDASKNARGSMYHVREPKTRVLTMSVPDYAEASGLWATASRLCTDVCVGTASSSPLQIKRCAKPKLTLSRALDESVDWEWLETWRRSQGYGPCLEALVRTTSEGTAWAARYEEHDQLIIQTLGRSRIWLFDPSQAFRGLYPFPVHHAYDRYSSVDFSDVDAERCPKAAETQPIRAVLGPGDVVYIPAYWFVLEESISSSGSLRLRFAQGSRALPDAAVAVQLSREIESRFADLEGFQNVRRWVEISAHGEELSHVDLETVKGYKRLCVCEAVRDDAEAVVGPDAWGEFLLSIADGRLLPTAWLNKDFRDPLYLHDVPAVQEDDRTDEERRYPELFRHQLRSRGWSTPAIQYTIPLPGLAAPQVPQLSAP